jgi:hypothetical protein
MKKLQMRKKLFPLKKTMKKIMMKMERKTNCVLMTINPTPRIRQNLNMLYPLRKGIKHIGDAFKSIVVMKKLLDNTLIFKKLAVLMLLPTGHKKL